MESTRPKAPSKYPVSGRGVRTRRRGARKGGLRWDTKEEDPWTRILQEAAPEAFGEGVQSPSGADRPDRRTKAAQDEEKAETAETAAGAAAGERRFRAFLSHFKRECGTEARLVHSCSVQQNLTPILVVLDSGECWPAPTRVPSAAVISHIRRTYACRPSR